jgi:hypothetical protein
VSWPVRQTAHIILGQPILADVAFGLGVTVLGAAPWREPSSSSTNPEPAGTATLTLSGNVIL